MKKHHDEQCDCDPNVPHDCVCSHCRDRWVKQLTPREKQAMRFQLRNQVNDGILTCQKALEEANWDIDKAKSILRRPPVYIK